MTRQKLLQIEQELKKTYFERGEEIRGSILALLARQHVLLLGPPGSAKSLMVEDLCGRIGGNYFDWLFTKFTTPEEIFGPISLKALEQDKYTRITTGKLPEAHIAFLDEVWKASSSILNALLRIVNERKFDNNGAPQKVPLLTLFGASNELPESSELSALYDRFLLRYVTQYIADPQNFVNMLAIPQAPVDAKITLDELFLMQAEADKVAIPDEVYIAIVNLKEILKKENIISSDRRYKQALSLIRSSAYLSGRAQAAIEDLTILQHVLWSQQSEQKTVQKIVLSTINPILSRIQEILDMAMEIHHQALDPNILKDAEKASKTGIEANVKLKKVQKDLSELSPTPATAHMVADAQAKIAAYQDELAEKLLGLSKKHA
jgi:MoxR-like ATPase